MDQLPLPFFLTAEERKKIKRRKKLEKEKNKQEKIKLGLLPPPVNRVKMSNMLNVLTNEHI